ncbi:MAG: 3-oxoacyl-ACP reductase [Cyclobacteriaceae bacterium]|nr:MAG: 3-oxoacyl-ACP reductase [Cyclobacteriaceae bacterium]
MDLQLKDKVAVITGGSVGIGLAVAYALAAEGANLVLCARNRKRLFQVTEDIQQQFPVNAKAIQADVSKPEDIESLVRQINGQYQGIDILINNAGVGSNETIMNAADEKWQYYWDLHVMAAVRLSRALVPLMKNNGGGVILNNSSICAKQPLYYEPIYNTTKAALSMFSKCLAHEVIGENIRVNTVNPGLIMTPDWRKTAAELAEKEGITADEYLDRLAKKYTPIGRFATPEELAKFFVFLCSPAASYSVGSTYYVDGGWLNVVN